MQITDELDFEKELTKNSRVLVINPINTYWSYQITGEATLRASRKAGTTKWMNVAAQVGRRFEINTTDNLPSWRYTNTSKRMEQIFTVEQIISDSKYTLPKKTHKIPDFASIEDLRKYQYNDLNFGAIVFSAIASVKHSTSFDLHEVLPLIKHFFSLGFEIYERIEAEILQFNPTHILTTNDRLVGSAIAISLAKKYSRIGTILYWGSDANKIQDYANTLYDSKQWQSHITLNWENNPPTLLDLEALQMEINRLADGPNENSRKYTHEHILGKTIQKKRITCIFYAQSEHEHSGHFIPKTIGRFANQYEAFKALQEATYLAGFDLYLKYHPIKRGSKLKSKQNSYSLDWKSISLMAHVQEIGSDSDLDTYQLIDDADFNIVWSSTVGLESIARERPTIILGDPYWLNLSWGIHAWSSSQLNQLLNSQISHPSKEILMPYLWHAKNFGSDMKYFRLSGDDVSYRENLILKERFGLRLMFRVIRSVQFRSKLAARYLSKN